MMTPTTSKKGAAFRERVQRMGDPPTSLMAQRHAPRVLTEFDERLPWVLLAVDRFGSFGSETAAGETLLNAKLIRQAGPVYVVTARGAEMVRKINRARG